MSDEIRVDPDTLRHDSARMAELGDRVGRTHAGLRDCLAAAEGCWGDDDLGTAFAANFEPHAHQLLANLRAMEESLRDTARQVANAAGDFEAQDIGGASHIGRAADEPSAPQNSGTGTQPTSPFSPASAPAQENASAPMGSAPAADTSAAQSPPAAPAVPGGATTPQSMSGAQPGAPGRSSSQTGPPAPNGPQSQEPSRQPPDRQGGANSTGDPSRRPPSTGASPPVGVSPPATGRATSSGAAAPSKAGAAGRAATPARGAGVDVKRETPWTGPPPKTPRGPASADQNPSSPQSGAPPRSPKEGEGKRDRPADAERSASRSGVSPLFVWLARSLSDRHGVTVVGFDLPGLQESPVRQFAAAIDRVLTDYPAIELDIVAVAELDDVAEGVRWRSEPGDFATVRSITLDQRVARESSDSAGTPETGADADEPAVYAATVGELGLALNGVGGDVARRTAQHTLITQYMRMAAGRYTTLAELLRGYRRWRAEWSGADTGGTGFDPCRALSAAFAEVVLRGGGASPQARVLYTALVDAAVLAR
ncbi:WXG100 family type VII secretion target [Nocardia thraciensis]